MSATTQDEQDAAHDTAMRNARLYAVEEEYQRATDLAGTAYARASTAAGKAHRAALDTARKAAAEPHSTALTTAKGIRTEANRVYRQAIDAAECAYQTTMADARTARTAAMRAIRQ